MTQNYFPELLAYRLTGGLSDWVRRDEDEKFGILNRDLFLDCW
jgi:hypothetical protein